MKLFKRAESEIVRVVESITRAPIKAKLGGVELEVPRPSVRTSLQVEAIFTKLTPHTEEGVSIREMIQTLQQADALTEAATLFLTDGEGSSSLRKALARKCTPTEIANFVLEVLTAEGEVEVFFVFTTFLSHRQSRLAPTREVETPSGE